jgi:mono/diheme cytochrome c family protein
VPPPPTQGTYEAGRVKYMAMCSGCHSAGKVDTSGTAGDLAGEAGDLVSDLGRVNAAMKGLMLSAQDILDLKAFLRAADSPPPAQSGACAARAVTWSQGASSCDAAYAGGAQGTSTALSDVTGPTTGTATAACSNGTLTVTAPLCSTAAPPPPPAPCPAQTVTWTQGTSTCNAPYAGGASGASAALSDVIGPTTGTATASCNNGGVSVSAAVCSTAQPSGSAAAGQAKYDSTCAGCHKAGAHDPAGPFSDLKGRQNNVVANLGSINGAMSGIMLTAQEVLDMKAFLAQVQ